MNSCSLFALTLCSCSAASTSGNTVVTAPCPAPSTSATTAAAEFVPREQRGPRLIRIEGGDFEMGSNHGGDLERPAHRVHVDTFYMDETEVTAGQYAQCVKAGVCAEQKTVLWDHVPPPAGLFTRSERAQLAMENDSCNLFRAGREDHPMNCVDWYQANRFCAWTFKRLPTEEEWEFAARGPEGRIYPWGNDAATADRANICGEECEDEIKPRHIVNWIGKREWNDSFVTTSPVAAQPNGRTPDGLFGLEGNVSEWTAKPLCGYDDALCFVQAIAIRGGAWVSFDAADSWYRGGSVPVTRHAYVGFRCARAPLTDSPK